MTLQEQAEAALAAACAAVAGPEARGVLVLVLSPVGQFHWKASNIAFPALGRALGEVIGQLAAQTPPVQFYACKLCGVQGHQHGHPPLDGWIWTRAKALVCGECRVGVTPVMLVPSEPSLVPRLDGVWEEDGPDLGQAPTNLGNGPTPLLLGEDEPEAGDEPLGPRDVVCCLCARIGLAEVEGGLPPGWERRHVADWEGATCAGCLERQTVGPAPTEAPERPVAVTMPAVAPPVTNEADEVWVNQGSEQGAMGPAAVPTGRVPWAK